MSKKNPLSCDFISIRHDSSAKKASQPESSVYKYRGQGCWKGVKTERYKPDADHWREVIRRTIVGDKGEQTKFHLRYFEISPGGHTTLERHRHEHVVIIVRGRGICIVGGEKRSVEFMDVCYIAPEDVHRLENPTDEPFGFFCLVDAKRDKPRPE